MIRTAGFSEEKIYRYTLGRSWRDEATFAPSPTWDKDVLWIMLNPSTADDTQEDPTVAKCMRLSRRWGFGGCQVRNIFAYRSTNPAGLKQTSDPVGPDNDRAIVEAIQDPRTGLIVVAWGNHGRLRRRGNEVRRMLEASARSPVRCFDLSLQDEPVHPLYQRDGRLEDLRLLKEDW